MEKKNPTVFITDTINDIDLKIFESTQNEQTIFTLAINKKKDDSKFILKIDEEIAAIIFEGLNQIFVEDDSDYQRGSSQNTKEINVEDFFKILNSFDKKHFGNIFGEEEDI